MQMVRNDCVYREKTDSIVGYEDWVFSGYTIGSADTEILYGMENDRGIYYYTEEEINDMDILKYFPVDCLIKLGTTNK